jgi:UDP-glucose 4-epimerase
MINELKNPHNDKKVVFVTGGCGFIGKHLINKLIKGNYFPIIIDDLSNSSLKSIKKYRHQILFIKQSILDLKGIENKLMQFNPYAIIHLAALHYIPYCIKYPQKTKEINVQGTKSLLVLAKNLKIDKFIFASSAAVYSPAERAHKETDKLKGIDIYGKTKISAEKLIRYFSKKIRTKFIILRLFNVYGPDDIIPHFIPSIIEKTMKSSDISVGNIETKRDYVYVDDVADAFICALNKKNGNNIEIYNIGSGIQYSGLKIIQLISKIMKKKIIFNKNPKLCRKIDRKYLFADNKNAFNYLNWKPCVGILAGLRKTIHETKKNIGDNN